MPTAEELARAYAPSYYGATRRKFVGPVARTIGWFQEGRARTVLGLLGRSGAGAVLDVGCGNGDFLRSLARRGVRVVGTELSAESARRASPEGDLDVRVGELHRIADLPGAGFAAVTLWHVLEHVPEPLETLCAARRLLAPGGWLVVSLPNAESWQARVFGRHWFHADPPRHLWHFSPRTLRRLCRRAGFTAVREDHFSMEQNPYGWLQSALNACGFEADRLYDTLKRTRPAGVATLADVALGALLAAPALAASVLESAAGAGGTFTLVARRDSSSF